MFCVAVYAAILRSKKIPDVLRLFETEDGAVSQCLAWTSQCPAVTVHCRRGYVYYACYGSAAETVRVERLTLELADPADEEDTLGLDPDPPHLVTRVELLRHQQEAREMAQPEEN